MTQKLRMWWELKKPGTGNPLHTQELVTVASFRTWRGWRERVARDRYLTLSSLPPVIGTNVPFPSRRKRRTMGTVSSPGTNSSVITLPSAIERYFQVSLYLLVLTGFGTIASTGAVDAPTVVLVGFALLFRGYLLSKRSDFQMPTRWTNCLTLVYIAFFFADYTMLSRSFLTATVHLVLFGMVIRIFSVHKERDYYMLSVLAFMMVLASAVLTVDSVFLFAFAGFMLM